jgi:hypothetical protein
LIGIILATTALLALLNFEDIVREVNMEGTASTPLAATITTLP